MIRRRRLLETVTVGTTGALITSGCQPSGSDDPERPGSDHPDRDGSGASDERPERPDPDLPLLGRLIAAEREMIETYRATIDAFPELPEWLRRHLKDHQRHLRALRDLERAARRSDADPTGSATPTPTPPSDRNRALLALRKQEQGSVDARDELLTEAHDGALARLIASVAASDALHRDRLAEEAG